MVIGLCLGVLAAVGLPAKAQVAEAFVFSQFSTVPGGPTAAPFSLTGSGGVRLVLDGAGVATSAFGWTGSEVTAIQGTMSYGAHTGTLNSGEGVGNMAARIASELAQLDDVGLFDEGSDAARNVDFGDNARLVLSFSVRIDAVMIAEDAGLDPFKLEYSPTADFASPILLFNGFNAATKSVILAHVDFGGNDRGSDLDQVFLFRLASALEPGYLRITETDNYGDMRLEIDFVGAQEALNTVQLPEPNGFVLATIGLSLAVLVLRRPH